MKEMNELYYCYGCYRKYTDIEGLSVLNDKKEECCKACNDKDGSLYPFFVYTPTLCPICKERPVTHYPCAPDDEDSDCDECREELKKDVKNRHCPHCICKAGVDYDTHVTHKWYVVDMKTKKVVREQEICSSCVFDVGVDKG